MLRETRQIIHYPSKTVLADVLTRTSGYNDPEAYSPFKGMPELIDEQFRGIDKERFVLEDCLTYCYQQDLNPAKVKIPVLQDGWDIGEKQLAGWTYLEDMLEFEEHAKIHFTRQLIGYKIHSGSPFNADVSYDTYLVGAGDDKDPEKELLEVQDEFDLELHTKILNEIPYLLKIIHRKSMELKVNLLSFLRAYAILTRYQDKASIQPQDWGRFKLIKIKGNGTFDRYLFHDQDNNGEFLRAGRNFLLGYNGYDEAYRACMKLIAYYNYLGINWEDEDPEVYDHAFMNRLICTYLPDNTEYYQKYGELDGEVANALKPENLFKLGERVSFFNDKQVFMKTRTEILDYIKNSINVRKLMRPSEFSRWNMEERSKLMLQFLELWYSRDRQVTLNLKDRFKIIDGFYYTLKSQLLVTNMQFLGSWNNYTPNVIFSAYGFVCILPDRFEEDVKFIPVEKCIERFKAWKGGMPFETGWSIL